MNNIRENFTPAQAEVLVRHFTRVSQRLIVVTVALMAGTALGFGYGLYQLRHQEQRIEAEQSARIQDGIRASIVTASLAYQTCIRQQDGRRSQAELVHLAIPLHAPGRTAQQEAEVMRFYNQLRLHHVLQVPSCKKP